MVRDGRRTMIRDAANCTMVGLASVYCQPCERVRAACP